MTEYLQLVGLALIGGLASLSLGAVLLSRKGAAEKLAHFATPFAAGALLAAVFLDLLKEGAEIDSIDTVLLAALIGMLLFFMGERFLRWFHHHHGHQDEKHQAEKSLIIVGDTVHNALDGVAIAAAFLISPATGVVTTLAVAAHEIPQEIGDFGLLLSRGMSRGKVLLVNILSSLSTVAAALIVYALGSSDTLPVGTLLGLSAGFLLYIAASDVIPEIHEHKPKKRWFDWQVILLVAGVLVVGFAINISHRYIHEEHDYHEELSEACKQAELDDERQRVWAQSTPPGVTLNQVKCMQENEELHNEKEKILQQLKEKREIQKNEIDHNH